MIAGTPVVSVPEGLPDEVVCPANCATATVMAAMRAGGGCRGEIVLIQGAGMLGLTACAVARSRGASQIIVCDIDETRLKQAERFGASHCVAVGEGPEMLARTVMEISRGRGVDLALELSGAASAMAAAVPLLRTGGALCAGRGRVSQQSSFPGSGTGGARMAADPGRSQLRSGRPVGRGSLSRAAPHPISLFRASHPDIPLTEVSQAFQYAVASRALRVGLRP